MNRAVMADNVVFACPGFRDYKHSARADGGESRALGGLPRILGGEADPGCCHGL